MAGAIARRMIDLSHMVHGRALFWVVFEVLMVLFALLKPLLVQNRLKHVQIVKSPRSHVMESDARFSGHKAAVCRLKLHGIAKWRLT